MLVGSSTTPQSLPVPGRPAPVRSARIRSVRIRAHAPIQPVAALSQIDRPCPSASRHLRDIYSPCAARGSAGARSAWNHNGEEPVSNTPSGALIIAREHRSARSASAEDRNDSRIAILSDLHFADDDNRNICVGLTECARAAWLQLRKGGTSGRCNTLFCRAGKPPSASLSAFSASLQAKQDRTVSATLSA